MIYAGATDYVRASAGADGGITGVMKLAALAEAHGLDVELHGGSLAHRHCMAAIRNTNYLESGGVHPKVPHTRAPIYAERKWLHELDSVDEHGCVEVPQGPGLECRSTGRSSTRTRPARRSIHNTMTQVSGPPTPPEQHAPRVRFGNTDLHVSRLCQGTAFRNFPAYP